MSGPMDASKWANSVRPMAAGISGEREALLNQASHLSSVCDGPLAEIVRRVENLADHAEVAMHEAAAMQRRILGSFPDPEREELGKVPCDGVALALNHNLDRIERALRRIAESVGAIR